MGEHARTNGIAIQQEMGRKSIYMRFALLVVTLSAFSCLSSDAYACFRAAAQRKSSTDVRQAKTFRRWSELHYRTLSMAERSQDTPQDLVSISEVTEKIQSAKESFDKFLASAATIKEAEAIRVQYLGKKGTINDAMSYMRVLPPDEKPKLGIIVNEIKDQMEIAVQKRKDELNTIEINRKMEEEALDVTLPGLRKSRSYGHRHPLSMTMEKAVDIFVKLGYDTVTDVEDSPEIETDYYCFEALNCPKVSSYTFYFSSVLFL